MPKPAPAEIQHTKVLYVDDDPASRRGFLRAMRRNAMGVDIDVAASGEEALELVRSKVYAAVATDLHMPGMNGLQLIEKLHSMCPEIPYLLVTGAPELDLQDTEGSRRITCILRKPWEAEELEDALARALELYQNRTTQEARAVLADEVSDNVRVLYVEDNPGDAELAHAMLGDAISPRYELTHVERLGDAADLLQARTFDIILADLSLRDARGMDGVTTLQRIVPSTPIVVVSGLSDDNVAMQAVGAGAQDYLVKGDITPQELRRSIRFAIERKGAQEHLAYLAHHDQLTGLANRTTFRDGLRQALARARRHPDAHPAVLMLDLDRFKSINDTLGHDAGDQLLMQVAARVSATVRESNLVARLGGDEFGILIEDIQKEGEVANPAQRVVEVLQGSFDLGGQAVQVTTSIGIAVYPENGMSVDDLLKNADSAMYRAKERGRNNYQFFDIDMHERALRRMELERDLVSAFEDDQFNMRYLPVSHCKTHQPVAFESHLEWEHPHLGTVHANEFIPLFEGASLGARLTQWQLQKSCAQIGRWQGRFNRPFRVSLKLTASQFDSSELVPQVARALRTSGVRPSTLELEIAEAIIMRNPDTAGETLQRLKSLGIRIATDDLGTGYSQLVYLVRFPIDVLRIDRSVIQTLGGIEGDTVTLAMIELGHRLGLEVVADGVEELTQLRFIAEQGCDLFQNQLATEALAPDDCENWIETSLRGEDNTHTLM